ncbi:MAG: LPS translocon maturation chaperone LptM [Burkholderiales bacterium]
MLLSKFILVRGLWASVCIIGLTACGQKGALFLPTSPAAAQRSSLPETLRPELPGLPGRATPASAPSSTPAR